MARRAIDIVVAGLALALLLVPGLVIALLIKLTSPGPIFFIQGRIGRGGRSFGFYKFRTMRVAAGGPAVTVSNDARITPIGRSLRRWKLDELPQFWNVLKGDMSLIGPRPETAKFLPIMRTCPAVLAQKPGIAGMAQLVYPHEAEMLAGLADPERAYAEQLLPRKLAVDAEYEATRTLASDCALLVEILLLVAGRRQRVDHDFEIEPVREGVVGR